jgi:glycosyltransferase involved in cell wall biosynthesis
MKRMKVILLSWGFDPERQGGIARFCIQIAESLQRLGVQTEVIGLLQQDTARERHERERLEAGGVHTALAPMLGDHPIAAGRIARWLLGTIQVNPQTFINVHGALAELCGLMMKVSSRQLKVVRTVHSEREWYKRPRLGKAIDLLSALLFDGEIGVSTSITSRINARRRLPRTALAQFIPPITSHSVVEQFDSLTATEARASYMLPMDKYMIGSVGRFTRQKGFDTLIRAVSLLKHQISDLQLAILGDGPLEAELRRQIAHEQLADTIRILAPRAAVGAFLRTLDLYVSSSRWEGLSLSVLEACMCGVPTVCTEVSGTADIQRMLGVDLLTCRPDRPEQLAEAILLAARSGATRRSQIAHPNSILLRPEAVAQEYIAYFATLA